MRVAKSVVEISLEKIIQQKITKKMTCAVMNAFQGKSLSKKMIQKTISRIFLLHAQSKEKKDDVDHRILVLNCVNLHGVTRHEDEARIKALCGTRLYSYYMDKL